MTSIEGTVLDITFRNDENGWTVLDLDYNGTLTTAVGCLPHIHAGELVRLFGAWTEHKIYGMQFSVKSVETRLPNTAESIRMFLASGLVKGVGDGLATRIVDKFGEETFDTIEHHPELLAEVRGISPKIARNIAESFAEHIGIKQTIIDLQNLGLSVKQAFRAFERYGAAAAELIGQNPYRMIDDIVGIGFERADRIAEGMGVDRGIRVPHRHGHPARAETRDERRAHMSAKGRADAACTRRCWAYPRRWSRRASAH